jgi:hypothetical protein
MRNTGTPIWIGEFGPVFVNPAQDDDKYRLLSDQLDLYESHGASWSIWAYKDIGGEGLVHAAPDSPWMRRIQPVLEKKERLGVDSWATTDKNIRDVMAPIEAVFDREYPGFDPFPFGRHRWVQTIVRSILLAEPMAEDFGRCFEGLEGDQLLALADSFRFDRCIRRERLAALIASKTGH